MNRLIDIPPEQLTQEQKTIFERLAAGRGRILGPYKIWIHSPTVASGMEHIGTYLNKRSTLDDALRRDRHPGDRASIGIPNYVRQAHIRLGKEAGLTQAQIDAILAGGDPKLADARERTVLPLCAGAGERRKAVGRRICRDRIRARPRRHRRGAGAARLLHLGRARHEGARGADPSSRDQHGGNSDGPAVAAR